MMSHGGPMCQPDSTGRRSRSGSSAVLLQHARHTCQQFAVCGAAIMPIDNAVHVHVQFKQQKLVHLADGLPDVNARGNTRFSRFRCVILAVPAATLELAAMIRAQISRASGACRSSLAETTNFDLNMATGNGQR
jgi:hypothetical protein